MFVIKINLLKSMFLHLINAVLDPITVTLLTLTVIIIIWISLLIRFINRRKNHYWTRKNVTVAQYPSMLKILIQKTRIELIEQELVRKYGNVFGTYHIGKQTLFCSDPELIGNILSKNFTTFSNRRAIGAQNPIAMHMLSRVNHEKWKRIRSIVSPFFSSGKLKKMRPVINECAQKLVNDFSLLIKQNNELDVKILFGAFTMNVIASVAFGVKVDALTDENNPLIVNAKKFFSFDFNLVDSIKFFVQNRFPRLAKFFNIDNLKSQECQYFSDLTKKIISDRMANRNFNETKINDFLQLLQQALDNENVLENAESHNKTMSTEEIVAQCLIFFTAGYETTASTLSYCAYNLACNPHIQHILYEEAKSVLQNKDEIDYELINSLKYTDAVISETLRLFTPGIALSREANADYSLGDKCIQISKGDIIRIPIYALHRDPENFAEPDKFKPERFFPENLSHHPYAYIPFGAGPRNCVARRLALIEAKLAILYSVYNFQFSLSDNTECPPNKVFGPLITPKQILIRVEKR